MAAAKPHMPHFEDIGILVNLIKTTSHIGKMETDHLEAAGKILEERSISQQELKGAVASVMQEAETLVVAWCGLQVTWVE